jgi:hypothetical protein
MKKDTDIVDELRDHEGSTHRDGFVCARCRGADEIERLRGLINNWVDAMEHDEVPYDGTIYPRAVNALREAVKRPFVD